jgi:1,2-diacylglycerol 3-alpha-glucosyltransferase
MNIGLFSDSYLPSLDGISYSIESFRVELEKRGHNVTVFAPAPGIRYKERTPNIVRFPAIKGLFYDDYLTSLFFPPEALQRVKKHHLDVIHFHTPSQVGLLGAYFALRNHIPLISTYHTDLYEYVSHYPAVLPGTIALSLLGPLITRGSLSDFRDAIGNMKPERNMDTWNKKIVVKGVTLLHNNCDYVIAPSHKIERQLRGWHTKSPIRILPTGVDKITTTTRAKSAFKTKFGIKQQDLVITFVGRLGSEKNLELLLSAFAIVVEKVPTAKLMLIGRHEHQIKLERMARELGISARVIFTGYVEHAKLGAAYESSAVFAFPSRTDTQGLVIHEAASAGLPIVMIDKDITEVVKDGKNGYFARNSAKDMANKLIKLLDNQELRSSMGAESIKLAAKYSEAHQAIQLEKLYLNAIEARKRAALPPVLK